MTTYTIKTLKKDLVSKEALEEIFNEKTNPLACENYGGGNHCNQNRIDKKLEIWGTRGESSDKDACMVTKIIFSDDKPAALFNIGKSGTPPTIIDKTHIQNGGVHEFSGLMVADQYFKSGLNTGIAETVKNFINNCQVTPGYTKAFVTYNPTHPYQEQFLSKAGGEILTEGNLETLLGHDSFHPARFKLENGKFYECTNYDQSVERVKYDGWHDSNPCIEWAEKTAMVFDVNNDHIVPHQEL